jgi:MFS family permease
MLLSRTAGDVPDDVARRFLRWTFLRAVFHQGYNLTANLYFVLDARLSAAQLVALTASMSCVLLLCDIPAGAFSDVIGRRVPLAFGHMLLAAGMMATGLVTAFPLIGVTQLLWGLGWAFSIGSDVAWLTDELAQPDLIDRTLAARARVDLAGAGLGMALFGALAWVGGLPVAVIAAGAGMALLGVHVAARFTEQRFTPAGGARLSASVATLRRGAAASWHDHEILVVFAATLLVNGAAMTTRLFPKRLVSLGLPGNIVLWYTALGMLALAAGVAALRALELRIATPGTVRSGYGLACLAGVAGLLVLALVPSAPVAATGVLLASGVSANVTRAAGVIWVNRRTTSDVRATVHSFLSQAESAGEIAFGFGLAALAGAAGIPAALIAAAGLVALAGVLVARAGVRCRSGR